MHPLHVLLIDDDLVTRRTVTCALKHVAGDTVRVEGLAAVTPDRLRSRLVRLEAPPDVLLLNLDTEGSALDFVDLLVEHVPGVPLVVMAPRTHDGAALAMRALGHGAAEVVTTPERPTHVLFAQRHLRKRLLPALRSVAYGGMHVAEPTAPPSKGLPFPDGGEYVPEAEVVVAGACTGGPQALAAWLGALPSDFTAPILVVQHFPQAYTQALARWLTDETGRTVREAPTHALLRPGSVWIAPGGRHLEVHREGRHCTIRTHRGPRELSCRPSIDVLFRSAARALGPHALGVVLSGAGHDGVAGAAALRAAGGSVLVQDVESALVWELPHAVIDAGHADAAMAPEALAAEVAARTAPLAGRVSSGGRVAEDERPALRRVESAGPRFPTPSDPL